MKKILYILVFIFMIGVIYAASPVTESSRIDPSPIGYDSDTLLGYCNVSDSDNNEIAYENIIYNNNIITEINNITFEDCLVHSPLITNNCSAKETKSFSSPDGNITISYKKSDLYRNAKWNVKYGWNVTTQNGIVTNITIPNDCFNYSNDNLTVGFLTNGPAFTLSLRCYNGTWKELESITGTHDLGSCSFGDERLNDNSYDSFAYWASGVNDYCFGSISQTEAQGFTRRWKYIYEESMIFNSSINYNESIEVNHKNVSQDNTSLNDEFIFSCRGFDGTNYSNWVNSSVTTIGLWMNLTFESISNGSITTPNNVTTFANTTIIHKLNPTDTGSVAIRWQGQSSNISQVMEFFNDGEDIITASLGVETEELSIQKEFKILGDGKILENARVVAEEWDGTQFLIIYGKLSNINGEATLLLKPDVDYRITVQHADFTSFQGTYSSYTGDTLVFTADLASTGGAPNSLSINNCNSVLREATNCTYTHICGDTCSEVNMTYTIIYNDSSSVTNSIVTSTTTGATNIIEITINVTNISMSIYEDGQLGSLLVNEMIPLDLYDNILPFAFSDITNTPRNNKIWIITLLILGIIIGGIFEVKVRKDTGIYTSGLWYILWGIQIPILMVMGVILAFYKLTLTIYRRIVNT